MGPTPASTAQPDSPDLPDLIDTPELLAAALPLLEPLETLAVDTEFLWERTYYPRLALVQVAGRAPEGVRAFAFDPLAVELAPLLDLLREPRRLKVLHAGRIDLMIFERILGAPIGPVFDAQIAASLTGFGPQIGYANLVQAVLEQKIKKTEQYADWTLRPLRRAQLEYALLDVVPLLDVHRFLTERLQAAGRLGWAQEEMAHLTEPDQYREEAPGELYLRIKSKKNLDARGLAILRELAIWRDGEARDRDLRPNFVARDEVLVDIAARRPLSLNRLTVVRGLHPNEARRSEPAIRACVQRGLDLPSGELPALPRAKRAGRSVGGAVDLMRAFLNQRADEVGVAAEVLATIGDLERLARDTHRERFAKDHPVLNGWRRGLVGDDLLRLLRGELALGVEPDGATLRLVEEEERR